MDGVRKRVLIAEDDRFLRRAAETMLKRHGFDVATAADGQEALSSIREHRPDLVLLDLIMPKMQGFEVLRVAKADDTIAAIPIVVLSNLSQESDLQRCRDAGALDFLVKSDLSLEQLVEYVRSHLDGEAGAGRRP
jgi:two-component system, OmpR family, alkaline phosphatase synthesis response regulator PhoP